MQKPKYAIGQRVIYTTMMEHTKNAGIKVSVDIPMTVYGVYVPSKQLVTGHQFYHYRLSTDDYNVLHNILEVDIKPTIAKE